MSLGPWDNYPGIPDKPNQPPPDQTCEACGRFTLDCGLCDNCFLKQHPDHMDDMDMYDEAESFYPEPPDYDEHGVRMDDDEPPWYGPGSPTDMEPTQ